MTITKTQLGRALGYLLLAVLIVAVPYGAAAFTMWSFNPATWPVWCRAVVVIAIAAVPLLLRLQVVDDASQRR